MIKGLYNDFKAKTINTEMTFQKVVNRTLSLYLTEEKFKKEEIDLVSKKILWQERSLIKKLNYGLKNLKSIKFFEENGLMR